MFSSHPEDDRPFEATGIGSFSADRDDVRITTDSNSFNCFCDTPADSSMLVDSNTEFSMPFGVVGDSRDPLCDPSCGSDDALAVDADPRYRAPAHIAESASAAVEPETVAEEIISEVSAPLIPEEELELKVELTSQDAVEEQLKNNIILDHEAAEREARFEAREDAQLRAFYAEESSSIAASADPDFRLLSYDMNDLDVDNGDDDGFVTGNVTTLKTGTDDIAIPVASPLHKEEETDQEEQVEQEEIVLPQDTDFNTYTPTIGDYSSITEEGEHLVPLLRRDFWSHFLTYFLAVSLCALCLVKVYQVQQTRDLTARLNEISVNNVGLQNQWLSLIAVRQNLSEHAKIRTYATETLHMVSPKIESEQVILLQSNKR